MVDHLGGCGVDRNRDHALVLGGYLQIGELAVEHGLLHEVPVPGAQAPVDKLAAAGQEDQADLWTPVAQHVAVPAYRQPSRRASMEPTVVFPLPATPVTTTIGRPGSRADVGTGPR